jgi:hypothetical protein
MDVYYIRLGGGEGYLGIPWWWFDVLLVWVGLMGAVIWLYGRAMARPTFAAWGVGLGGSLGWLFVRLMSNETPAPPFIVVAAIVGGVGGFLAYRILLGLAMSLGVSLAASILAAALISSTPSGTWDAVEHGAADVVGTVLMTTTVVEKASANKDKVSMEKNRQMQIEPHVIGAIQGVLNAWGQWWSALGFFTCALLAVIFLAALAGGFAAGLMWPDFSVTVVTGMGGALMMMGMAARIKGWILPDADLFPNSFGGWLILLAIVGGVGVAVQSVLFKDKQDEQYPTAS